MNNNAVEQLASLIEDNEYEVTLLANASAFLNMILDDVSWTGFYLYKDDELILGPFQGKVACTRIPLNKGVCGYSAYHKETIIVDNVHEFVGHIACDSASNSEIVIPLIVKGQLYGVLDIDSTSLARFSETDKLLLEACCNTICNKLNQIIRNNSF